MRRSSRCARFLRPCQACLRLLPSAASQRTIVVRVNPDKLRAYNMSPDEVVRALGAGNIMSARRATSASAISCRWCRSIRSFPDIKQLGDIPIRLARHPNGFLRDVGAVEDAADIQTGYALVNGRRTVYIPVTKRADASTLAVVNLVKRTFRVSSRCYRMTLRSATSSTNRPM